jgi:hypothetical protein
LQHQPIDAFIVGPAKALPGPLVVHQRAVIRRKRQVARSMSTTRICVKTAAALATLLPSPPIAGRRIEGLMLSCSQKRHLYSMS